MLLIRNANIKTMAGPDLKNGCLLLENGKTAAVGQTVDAPEGVETLDAQGRLLTPGCVEAHCHIGLDNEGMRWEGMDYNEIVEPLTPQLRAIDSINPQDEAFGLALRGGVTTACTGPGSANVVGGTFAIVKLAGKRVDRMILRAPAAMKCAFGENPKGCYGHDKRQSPMTRMAVAALLRELLLRTLRYRDDKEAGKNPAFDMKLEAMLPVVNGEIPLKCHAHRADDILTAVRIAREFGLKLTLDHCTDGELIAEFAQPEERHIVSVFKLIQELMAPSGVKGKNQFQLLMDRLPPDHKARWFSGAALSTGDQAMASIMSTAMSRLNAFLDSEMELVLCFDTAIDAERFCHEKSAIFLVLPEENPNAYFMASLLIQQLYREILSVADENGGRLPSRVFFYCDEFGTFPPIQSVEMMFSASRSRGLSIAAIIQGYQQLEKNYGREGAAIIQDNCQLTIAGGFAPSSETAEVISKALGSRTVMTGSVSRSKNDPSQSLQMTERLLMTADELKSMKKGSFIVMKTGAHPFVSQLKLFMKWGISFPSKAYTVEDRGARRVQYISRERLIHAITDQFPQERRTPSKPRTTASSGPTMTEPVEATPEQELNHIAEQTKTPKPLRTG